MQKVMLVCRPGFENEAGQELMDHAALLGFFGYFQPVQNAGLVCFTIGGEQTSEQLMAVLPLSGLVFTRDWFVIIGECHLPSTDRVGAVVEFLYSQQWRSANCGRVEVRLSENNDDRDLGNFARKWVAPLSKALRGAGFLTDKGAGQGAVRLDIVLSSFEKAIIGFSLEGNRAHFLSGIPRLRLPASAPSRSALKLEEAWKVFLPESRWQEYLGGGKKAVDLGAAPGGWTWQMVRQGMMVTAIDNGPMDPELMATGQVEHVEADGYSWRPKKQVDWMVCDIVDKPRKTAGMVAAWISDKLCRYTMFNLKLPMKKRYEEWQVCRELITEKLGRAGIHYELRARHLYHDREEITCFIERLDLQ